MKVLMVVIGRERESGDGCASMESVWALGE